MAFDAIQSTAAAYQGRSQVTVKPQATAKPAEEKTPAMPTTDGSEPVKADTSAEPKPFQAAASEQNGKENDILSGEGTHQATKQLKQAVEQIRKNLMSNTEAVFGIHEGTNRVMIKIVDKETKDVVKEFPPEQTLDMIQKVWEMAGIMVDEKR